MSSNVTAVPPPGAPSIQISSSEDSPTKLSSSPDQLAAPGLEPPVSDTKPVGGKPRP